MIFSKNYMILFAWAKQKYSFAQHKINRYSMLSWKRKTLLSVIFVSTVAYSQKVSNPFISPLKIPLSLSASFGELRADHFHSGIDIKTQGVTGKEVVASDDGYVYLLKVSPAGFGKAIFVRHPSGFSTVYGHLNLYTSEIEEYVKTKQYENKSFDVTIYPPEGRFVVRKGEIIGYSGNSGSSSGPHLHFEIRKSDGEKPINPLLFNFGVEDNLKPVIERLKIYKGSFNTSINRLSGNLLLNLTGADGNYTIPGDSVLEINGLTGFGLTCYDLMNNTPNKFGINSIELQIDTVTRFSYEINQFSFFETRYINAHIDYDAALRNNIEIERTFVLPNDKLSLYKTIMNNGLYDFNDSKTHLVKIIVKDGSNNKAILSFKVRPSPITAKVNPTTRDTSIRIMPYNKSNLFIDDGVKVNIPEGALYDTLYFKFSKSEGKGNLFSDIFHIHNKYTPLQKAINLSLKPHSIPTGKGSKLIIAQVDENQKTTYAGGNLSEGYITADVLSFGNYAITLDTIPPVITANGLIQGADLSEKNEIRIKITDNLSGIKAYTGIIDGKWSLFEYDPRYDLLVYKLDSTRISRGKKHKLDLRITDNCNNSTSLSRDFTW
jgi:hypothetical protein